jgi:hypothetical protein
LANVLKMLNSLEIRWYSGNKHSLQ